ncbi:MAG: ACT domain-containing protein [Bacteroidota bacterium]
MPKVTQLTIATENKPGALARICSVLAKEGVNIQAGLAPEVRGKGRVRLLVDDADRAKAALKAAKIRFAEEEVIALTLDNKPGALAEITEKLAKSKINIKYAYATTFEGAEKATVVLAVPNIEKALAALG